MLVDDTEHLDATVSLESGQMALTGDPTRTDTGNTHRHRDERIGPPKVERTWPNAQ
jgi:hypothetical protein